MASTDYLINLKYRVTDNASGTMSRMLGVISKLNSANGKLTSSLSGATTATDKLRRGADHAIISMWTLRKTVFLFNTARDVINSASGALVGYNSNMEQARIGLTQTIQMQMHLPFEKAAKAGGKLLETYRKMARESPGTTADFVDFSDVIAGTVLSKGGTLEDLAAFTKGGMLAGGSLPKGVAARDIKGMLEGTVTNRDPLANQILSSMGIKKEEFNKMSSKKRMDITRKGLTQDAILAAGKSQANSFSGSFSTLKDNIQYTLGQVGLPLTKALSKEFEKWNKWISANPKFIAQFANDFGTALKEGFSKMLEVGKWISSNKDMLMSMAKVALLFKGGSLLAGAGASLFSKAGGATGVLNKSLSQVIGGMGTGGGLSGLAAALNPGSAVMLGLAGLAAAAMAAAAAIDKKQETDIGSEVKQAAMQNLFFNKHLTGPAVLSEARRNNVITKDGQVDRHQISRLTGRSYYDPSIRGYDAEILEAVRRLNGFLASEERDNNILTSKRWYAKFEEMLFGRNITPNGTGDTNVTIEKIEVASEDPDRFVHDLVRSFDKVRRHGTQAVTNGIGGGTP